MRKIIQFMNKIYFVYFVVYLIVMHISALVIHSYLEIDFNQSTADIILDILSTIIIFLVAEICILLPTIFLFAVSSIISFFAAISIPLFLVLSLFDISGSEQINVLDYGFLRTLLICILVTPFGIMNLFSTIKVNYTD